MIFLSGSPELERIAGIPTGRLSGIVNHHIPHYLRTNPRTLENWEQGRAKPNAQAALLIRMVERFPDMVKRLESV